MIIHPGYVGIDISKAHLDIFDASLARLSSIEMPLRTVRGMAYTEALPIDLNGLDGYALILCPTRQRPKRFLD